MQAATREPHPAAPQGANSGRADAYGTLVISAIILCGAGYLCYEVALHVAEWRRSPQPAEMLSADDT